MMSSGNTLAMLNLDGFKIGIGICYDIRFEELARIYRNNGNQSFYHFFDEQFSDIIPLEFQVPICFCIRRHSIWLRAQCIGSYCNVLVPMIFNCLSLPSHQVSGTYNHDHVNHSLQFRRFLYVTKNSERHNLRVCSLGSFNHRRSMG